jgi:2,4-dienoyl-CoA reductase-like NADH-dependent reductase (Old Yellow Enzyme family)
MSSVVTKYCGPENVISKQLTDWYIGRAKRKAGLIAIEATYVQNCLARIVLTRKEYAQALRKIVKETQVRRWRFRLILARVVAQDFGEKVSASDVPFQGVNLSKKNVRVLLNSRITRLLTGAASDPKFRVASV